jgi:peptidylprolyl isomerase
MNVVDSIRPDIARDRQTEPSTKLAATIRLGTSSVKPRYDFMKAPPTQNIVEPASKKSMTPRAVPGCVDTCATSLALRPMADKPVISAPEGEPPTELVIDDLIVGDGEEATVGKRVIVHYVGVAWSNGREFDASWNRGDTFDFRLGAREVIEGWDRGVKGMKVGGRRQLTIPPDLGYGSRGAGGAIKGGETLVFVVDLVAVK